MHKLPVYRQVCLIKSGLYDRRQAYDSLYKLFIDLIWFDCY